MIPVKLFYFCLCHLCVTWSHFSTSFIMLLRLSHFMVVLWLIYGWPIFFAARWQQSDLFTGKGGGFSFFWKQNSWQTKSRRRSREDRRYIQLEYLEGGNRLYSPHSRWGTPAEHFLRDVVCSARKILIGQSKYFRVFFKNWRRRHILYVAKYRKWATWSVTSMKRADLQIIGSSDQSSLLSSFCYRYCAL